MIGRLTIIAAAAAFVLSLAGCQRGPDAANQASSNGAQLTQISAPQGDWTQVVSETPEGGFRMGNPDAPVKLVEYASLTCPYCGRFAAEGVPTLRDRYVRRGQVSWEFRTFLNHPTDPGISLLLHCRGAAPFFQLAEQIYATQTQWVSRVEALPQAQLQQIQSLPPSAAAAAFVRAAGLDAFFRQHGMPQSRIDSCLADPAGMAKLMAINARGQSDGIGGTPNFLINGQYVSGASSWSELEPRLSAAIQ